MISGLHCDLKPSSQTKPALMVSNLLISIKKTLSTYIIK